MIFEYVITKDIISDDPEEKFPREDVVDYGMLVANDRDDAMRKVGARMDRNGIRNPTQILLRKFTETTGYTCNCNHGRSYLPNTTMAAAGCGRVSESGANSSGCTGM